MPEPLKDFINFFKPCMRRHRGDYYFHGFKETGSHCSSAYFFIEPRNKTVTFVTDLHDLEKWYKVFVLDYFKEPLNPTPEELELFKLEFGFEFITKENYKTWKIRN